MTIAVYSQGEAARRVGLREKVQASHIMRCPAFTEANLSNFEEEVLRAPWPVLVGFWAEWSSSCSALTPLLRSLAEGNGGALKVVTVDVEQNEALADRYLVRSVPTLLIFQHGTVQDSVVGRTTELDLREKLERFL